MSDVNIPVRDRVTKVPATIIEVLDLSAGRIIIRQGREIMQANLAHFEAVSIRSTRRPTVKGRPWQKRCERTGQNFRPTQRLETTISTTRSYDL